MSRPDRLNPNDPTSEMNGPVLDWDKCNVCGKRFPNWRTLWAHKRNHTQEEVDARTIGPTRNESI